MKSISVRIKKKKLFISRAGILLYLTNLFSIDQSSVFYLPPEINHFVLLYGENRIFIKSDNYL